MMGSPLGGLRRTLALSPATLGTENAELDRELEGLGVVLDCFLATELCGLMGGLLRGLNVGFRGTGKWSIVLFIIRRVSVVLLE
jgi:hypothetical protein